MDVVSQFISEQIVVGKNCIGEDVRALVVYKIYVEWALGQGERPVSNKAFSLALSERGIQRARRMDANYFLNIKVLRHSR